MVEHLTDSLQHQAKPIRHAALGNLNRKLAANPDDTKQVLLMGEQNTIPPCRCRPPLSPHPQPRAGPRMPHTPTPQHRALARHIRPNGSRNAQTPPVSGTQSSFFPHLDGIPQFIVSGNSFHT